MFIPALEATGIGGEASHRSLSSTMPKPDKFLNTRIFALARLYAEVKDRLLVHVMSKGR